MNTKLLELSAQLSPAVGLLYFSSSNFLVLEWTKYRFCKRGYTFYDNNNRKEKNGFFRLVASFGFGQSPEETGASSSRNDVKLCLSINKCSCINTSKQWQYEKIDYSYKTFALSYSKHVLFSKLWMFLDIKMKAYKVTWSCTACSLW